MIRRQKEGLSYLLTFILPYNAPRIVVPKADYMGVICYFGINLVSTLMQGTAAGIYGIRRLQIKCCGELARWALLALDCCFARTSCHLSIYDLILTLYVLVKVSKGISFSIISPLEINFSDSQYSMSSLNVQS